ncbi:hypothetical protein CUB95_09975 [Prevotella intermedia]|nr:hypothetical protein CUB95_09975 [Prevotella intermedia]
MQGKSGCFAMQNSRFRNAKSKLLFFKEIIFTKSRLLLSLLLELLEKSRITMISIQHPTKAIPPPPITTSTHTNRHLNKIG